MQALGTLQTATYSVVQSDIDNTLSVLLTPLNQTSRIIRSLLSNRISTTINPNQHGSQRLFRNRRLVLRAIKNFLWGDHIQEQTVLRSPRVLLLRYVGVGRDIGGLVELRSRQGADKEGWSNVLTPNRLRLGADTTLRAGLHFATVLCWGDWCAESKVTDGGSSIADVAEVVSSISLLF